MTPFIKFFNLRMITREAFYEDERKEGRIYQNFNKQVATLTDEERQEIVKVLERPTKEMFKFLGFEIDIREKE
jgi:hypothetical protein